MMDRTERCLFCYPPAGRMSGPRDLHGEETTAPASLPLGASGDGRKDLLHACLPTAGDQLAALPIP